RPLLQGGRTVLVDPEPLAHALHGDGRGHSSSAKSPERWKNVRHARTSSAMDPTVTAPKRMASHPTLTGARTGTATGRPPTRCTGETVRYSARWNPMTMAVMGLARYRYLKYAA